MLVICVALGLILWMCCLYTETTRSRQQREQRADRSKERRPPKPVRKVHRAAPSSDLNAKPGIIILFLCERANTPSHLFWIIDSWKAKHVEQFGRILSRVSAYGPRASNIELSVYLEGFSQLPFLLGCRFYLPIPFVYFCIHFVAILTRPHAHTYVRPLVIWLMSLHNHCNTVFLNFIYIRHNKTE